MSEMSFEQMLEVVRETGWIERANNPKYPLEYIQAADRLANGKKKLLFPKK